MRVSLSIIACHRHDASKEHALERHQQNSMTYRTHGLTEGLARHLFDDPMEVPCKRVANVMYHEHATLAQTAFGRKLFADGHQR